MTTYSADTPTVSSDGGAWRTGPLTSTVPVPRRPTGVDGDHHDRSGVVGVHTRRQDPTWERVIRRALDVTVSAVVLLLLAPLWIAIMLWVRSDSPGPALLRQERIGLGHRPFTLFKFRSMRMGGDDRAHRLLIESELRGEDTKEGGSTKLNDARITPSGRFLRRTSLDEIPQLINVLRGDMSLVGPRPCLPWEADLFGTQHAERFLVAPGITGLWQVTGRSTVGTLEMLRLDVAYVRARCLTLDLRILLRTIPSLLRGDGAR